MHKAEKEQGIFLLQRTGLNFELNAFLLDRQAWETMKFQRHDQRVIFPISAVLPPGGYWSNPLWTGFPSGR
jgi:hypothetical protein